jgi:hypothetical protein
VIAVPDELEPPTSVVAPICLSIQSMSCFYVIYDLFFPSQKDIVGRERTQFEIPQSDDPETSPTIY